MRKTVTWVGWMLLLPVAFSVPSFDNVSRQEDASCRPIFDADPPREETSRISSFNSPPRSVRVIGGLVANPNLAQMMVHVFTDEDSTTADCTGVLVRENIVFAPNYCRIQSGGYVYVGALSSSDYRSLTRYDISTVEKYPRDDDDLLISSGFVSLTLSTAVPNPKTMKVNFNPLLPKTEGSARVVGIGRFSASGDNDNADSVLYQVDVPLVSFEECKETYKDKAEVDLTERHFCAGDSGSAACRACDGDGPVIQYDENNEAVLVGMVAGFPVSCDNAEFLNIIAKVGPVAEEYLSDSGVSQALETTCITPERTWCGSKLAVGAIVGIVVGVLAFIILIGILFCVVKKCTSNTTSEGPKIQEVDPDTLKPVVPVNDNSPQLTSGPISSSSVVQPGSMDNQKVDVFSLGPSVVDATNSPQPNYVQHAYVDPSASAPPVTGGIQNPATPITPLAVSNYNPYSTDRGLDTPNNLQ